MQHERIRELARSVAPSHPRLWNADSAVWQALCRLQGTCPRLSRVALHGLRGRTANDACCTFNLYYRLEFPSVPDNRCTPSVVGPLYNVQKDARSRETRSRSFWSRLQNDTQHPAHFWRRTLTCACRALERERVLLRTKVVSLARVLKHTHTRATQGKITEDEINAAGFKGEKGHHGTPSGL